MDFKASYQTYLYNLVTLNFPNNSNTEITVLGANFIDEYFVVVYQIEL